MTWPIDHVAFWLSIPAEQRLLWRQRAAWIALHPPPRADARYWSRYARAVNMFARAMQRFSPDLRAAVHAASVEPHIRLDSPFWVVFKAAAAEERRRRRRVRE